MSRVLVTAGSGLIGSAVVRALQRHGYETVVLDERESPAALSSAKWVRGRTNDSDGLDEAIRGCCDVIHLEWNSSTRDTVAAPTASHDRNVTPSVALLDRCRQENLGFFFASTAFYRGDVARPSGEDSPRSESSVYYSQKAYLDALTSSYAASYGIRGACLRIFNAYGTGGRPYIIYNRILDALNGGPEVTLLGDGLQIRDFIHVEDIAAAFLAALRTASPEHRSFNVGSGRGTTMLELVEQMAKVAGREVPVRFGPVNALEARYLIADTSRIQKELGWSPSIPLEEGLNRLVAGD